MKYGNKRKGAFVMSASIYLNMHVWKCKHGDFQIDLSNIPKRDLLIKNKSQSYYLCYKVIFVRNKNLNDAFEDK